jgi:hypothetical protein
MPRNNIRRRRRLLLLRHDGLVSLVELLHVRLLYSSPHLEMNELQRLFV